MYEGNINTSDDVRRFFIHLLKVERLNFHPDENFSNYVSNNAAKSTFSKRDVERYNFLMCKAFEICKATNIDIYELAIDCLKQYNKV